MTRRDFEALLRDLGYHHDRTAKHMIWTNGQYEIGLSMSTRATVKPWLVDKLRKRHPDHPALKRDPGAGKGKNHGRDRHRQSTLAAVPSPKREEYRQRPELTSCVDCGRLWLSDLNPRTRPCPRCGGVVEIGRLEQREFRFEREMAA